MRSMLRVALRLAAGFFVGLGLWLALAPPYERAVAAAAELFLRATESPATTRLDAGRGEIIFSRSDLPPASPRPGLPADNLHFNFVLLVALFASDGRLWQSHRAAMFAGACAILFLVHVAALVFAVRALYATQLGPWSEAHFGVVARNVWAGGYHLYRIAGRFAAPFAIWWPLRKNED
jgi:hypothetical protein